MQHNGPARNAVLPTGEAARRFGARPCTRRNDDLLRACGLSGAEIEALGARARAQGVDSLVQLCAERGVSNLNPLLQG